MEEDGKKKEVIKATPDDEYPSQPTVRSFDFRVLDIHGLTPVAFILCIEVSDWPDNFYDRRFSCRITTKFM